MNQKNLMKHGSWDRIRVKKRGNLVPGSERQGRLMRNWSRARSQGWRKGQQTPMVWLSFSQANIGLGEEERDCEGIAKEAKKKIFKIQSLKIVYGRCKRDRERERQSKVRLISHYCIISHLITVLVANSQRGNGRWRSREDKTLDGPSLEAQ